MFVIEVYINESTAYCTWADVKCPYQIKNGNLELFLLGRWHVYSIKEGSWFRIELKEGCKINETKTI